MDETSLNGRITNYKGMVLIILGKDYRALSFKPKII